MEITPSKFMIDFGATNDECLIGFSDFGSTDFFLLGDVFLREYYVIHDEANNKIGISPNTYSTATMVTGTEPATTLEPYQDGGSTIDGVSYKAVFLNTAGVASIFGAVGGLLFLVYFKPVMWWGQHLTKINLITTEQVINKYLELTEW